MASCGRRMQAQSMTASLPGAGWQGGRRGLEDAQAWGRVSMHRRSAAGEGLTASRRGDRRNPGPDRFRRQPGGGAGRGRRPVAANTAQRRNCPSAGTVRQPTRRRVRWPARGPGGAGRPRRPARPADRVRRVRRPVRRDVAPGSGERGSASVVAVRRHRRGHGGFRSGHAPANRRRVAVRPGAHARWGKRRPARRTGLSRSYVRRAAHSALCHCLVRRRLRVG